MALIDLQMTGRRMRMSLNYQHAGCRVRRESP